MSPLGEEEQEAGHPGDFWGLVVQVPPSPCSGETWSTLGAQVGVPPSLQRPVQPGGVALSVTEMSLLWGAPGAGLGHAVAQGRR